MAHARHTGKQPSSGEHCRVAWRKTDHAACQLHLSRPFCYLQLQCILVSNADTRMLMMLMLQLLLLLSLLLQLLPPLMMLVQVMLLLL